MAGHQHIVRPVEKVGRVAQGRTDDVSHQTVVGYYWGTQRLKVAGPFLTLYIPIKAKFSVHHDDCCGGVGLSLFSN